jgi:ABC-type transport system involved in multi-copper enzyme maturation permease subunit
MGALRLTWRLQRWEIAFVAVGCLALVGVAVWLTLDMQSVLASCGTPAATDACDVIFAFQETHGSVVGLVQGLIGFVPIVAGLVLGIPIVTREIEQRTAMIAWPMARSRWRWLMWRVLPVLAIAVALVAPLAFAADQMAQAHFPHSDIGFVQYDARGVALVMRAAVILVAGVAIGSMVGRLLPSLLVGIGLSVALTIGLDLMLDRWVPSTMLSDIESDPAAAIGGRLHTDIRYRLPSGEVVSADEGESYAEGIYQDAGGEEPDPALLPEMLVYGVAPDRYWDVAIRETAALGAVGLGLFGVTAFVVQRRRPE